MMHAKHKGKNTNLGFMEPRMMKVKKAKKKKR